MTQYREILRLYSQGISQRSIASSCGCSRNTVAKVISKANELELSWNQCSGKTDPELEEILAARVSSQCATRKHPDLEYLHKEMTRHGVTLKLLWMEYCGQCRAAQELPLMYSQSSTPGIRRHRRSSVQSSLRPYGTARPPRKPLRMPSWTESCTVLTSSRLVTAKTARRCARSMC